MGSLRVLVENDRLLSSEKYAVPAPVVETGQTDHRYITLESAGRDEIVVDTHDGIDPISQEQAEWRMLTAMLGGGLTQAYLVQPGAIQPLLTLHAQDRATVETAGARIGLAKAVLVVDANGAYRGAQLYRVDNSLEQFLEIQLPAGARLWTAHVANEPVKPAAGNAAAPDVVRIPLIKTAHGDADYAVILKYGGQLGQLHAVDHVDFPLIRTVNIHVELSQVELYLPTSFDWFNFGGTMRLVRNEGDLTAGWLSYNTRQIDLARQALHSEDPFTRTRAAHNLKALQEESDSLKQTAEGYRGNGEVAQQLQANASVQAGLTATALQPVDQFNSSGVDNRARLGSFYKSQMNSRANEVVNSSGANFSQPTAEGRPVAGFAKTKAGDAEFRQNGVTTADSLPPSGAKDEKFGPSDGEMPGPTSALTLGGTGSISGFNAASGQSLNLPGPVDDPTLQERGGGVAMKDLERYAGRLAQQQDQTAGTADTNGSVFDWDKNAWKRKTKESYRGPQDAGAISGSGGLILNGGSTLATSGNNTYTGGTTINSGTLRTGRPQSGPQPGENQAADHPHGDIAPARDEGKGGGQASNGEPGLKLSPAPPAPPAPASSSPTTPPAPTVLVSLDLELHPSGVKYLFTTPRGEAAITARALSDSLAGRLVRLAGLGRGNYWCCMDSFRSNDATLACNAANLKHPLPSPPLKGEGAGRFLLRSAYSSSFPSRATVRRFLLRRRLVIIPAPSRAHGLLFVFFPAPSPMGGGLGTGFTERALNLLHDNPNPSSNA